MSFNPTNGIGPTQGQRNTLTRVATEPMTLGFDHHCSTYLCIYGPQLPSTNALPQYLIHCAYTWMA